RRTALRPPGVDRPLSRAELLLHHAREAPLGRTPGTRRARAMLTELRIRNFAIIESLSLPLARGFNVLSGETGAGKSIIVGALGLLLGERARADLIRTGADRATVEGVFDIADRKEISSLLDDHGFDAAEPLVVLTRANAASGRPRA